MAVRRHEIRGIQRFRTVSHQPFLDRGTVTRGLIYFFGVRCFRTRKNAVAYFSSRKRSDEQSAAGKGIESARAARNETGRGKWQVPREFMRRGRQQFKPQTVLLGCKASAGLVDLARSDTCCAFVLVLDCLERSVGIMQYWRLEYCALY